MERPPSKSTPRLSSRRSLPLYRSINGLAVLARYASMRGIDVALLLAGSGIKLGDLDDPDILVTPEQEITVIRNIIKLVPAPGLGLLIGRQYHTGVLGKIGAAAINSDTFLDAIQVIFQFYELLLTYFHFDMKAEGSLVSLTLKELIDLKDIRLFLCEREFASIYRVASDLIGNPIKLEKVCLAYPKPRHASLYHDIFQCPLVFNAEDHRAVFDKSYLFRPLPMANPLARKTYEKECKELYLRIMRQGTISKRVIQEIQFHRHGIPGFDQLARYLNMSPRTLRRRLTEEGTSYKSLVSGIQKDKAIKLLQTTTLSIGQIAAEIGYNDLPNFYRAFKRWTGKNPGNYRAAASRRASILCEMV